MGLQLIINIDLDPNATRAAIADIAAAVDRLEFTKERAWVELVLFALLENYEGPINVEGRWQEAYDSLRKAIDNWAESLQGDLAARH